MDKMLYEILRSVTHGNLKSWTGAFGKAELKNMIFYRHLPFQRTFLLRQSLNIDETVADLPSIDGLPNVFYIYDRSVILSSEAVSALNVRIRRAYENLENK